MASITLTSQLQAAKKASFQVGALSHEQRRKLLRGIASAIRHHASDILRANAKDIASFTGNESLVDRLLLTPERVEGMAREIDGIVVQPDPIGQVFDRRERHGLVLYRKRVPFGVIGIVYEARPNVTTDVVGICLKAGNAVVLKGGKEGYHSYEVLVRIIHQVLRKNNIDVGAVQMIDPRNRALVEALITAEGYVDLVIPRGSQQLIEFVRTHATVPVIETGAGVCHTYIDASATLARAAEVVFNAKTQRPGVCNALDTVLVHRACAAKFLPLMAARLKTRNVELFADAVSYALVSKQYPHALLHHATLSDFGREFLSLKMSVKIVRDVHEAIDHINAHTSHHSEAILTNTSSHKKVFTDMVDAAVVYTNASTRFSDGAIFGLGSEIGISTQKMHARGPMGAQEMSTYKWVVRGKYSVRP